MIADPRHRQLQIVIPEGDHKVPVWSFYELRQFMPDGGKCFLGDNVVELRDSAFSVEVARVVLRQEVDHVAINNECAGSWSVDAKEVDKRSKQVATAKDLVLRRTTQVKIRYYKNTVERRRGIHRCRWNMMC